MDGILNENPAPIYPLLAPSTCFREVRGSMPVRLATAA
jgi:hypothetical protein